MSAPLFDAVTRIARHEAQARPVAAIGRVVRGFTQAGPGRDYAATIELRDSGLVLPHVPLATGVSGFAALPEPDDLVIVVFASANFHDPVVLGRLYSPSIPPPEHTAGRLTMHLPPGTDAAGADLALEVDGAQPQIQLRLGQDVTVTLDAEQVHIAVGDMQVTLTTAGGGRATVQAGDATLALEASGNATLEAANKLKIKAAEIDIEGSGPVKIKGATVDIN